MGRRLPRHRLRTRRWKRRAAFFGSKTELGSALDLANVHQTAETTGLAWSVLAACALHIVVFAVFGRSIVREPAPEITPIEVALEDEVKSPEDPQPQHQAAEANPDLAMATRRPPSATEESNSVAPPVDSAATPPVLQTTEPQKSGEAWTFKSTRGGVDLGLGDKTGSLARDMFAHGSLAIPKEQERAPEPLPTPVDPGVKMTQELDAADVARGFGRGGPVVQAIETAVRDAVPSEGSATFEVSILKSGGISVRVLEAALNRAEWERLTDAIAAIVKTKHIRFPESGLGLRVAVRVAASDHGAESKSKGKGIVGLLGSGVPGVAPGVGNPSGRDDAAMQQGNLPHSMPMLGGGFPMGGGGGSQSRIVSAQEVYEQRM